MLRADCAHASPRVLRIAVRDGACPAAATTSPRTGGAGNCGTDTLTLVPGVDADTTVRFGFKSNWGRMVYRNLAVGYASFGKTDGFPDHAYMFSSSYSAQRHLFTGVGTVTATLGGSVTLFYGLRCELIPITATTFVE
jgi:hypothetical protein